MNRAVVCRVFASMSNRVLMHATVAAVVALFCAGLAWPAGGGLQRPSGLEPDVAFWRRVFAEVTTRQALIHDNRFLGVIYEKVDLPAQTSDAAEKRFADAAKGKYERILRSLATGRRNDLTTEEARVLQLWPADATNEDFLGAAGRVRFQQGVADRFAAGLVRSGQWRDHIREVLQHEGVPEELAALPHVESSFNPAARSYVGAAGLWQFTGETGRRFMRIDSAVDERRDPFESSAAAARLLKYNNSILGAWPLAITAYNHGLSGMRRAAQALGTDDIETIVRRYDGPSFGFASRNFYVSFLAALDIDQDPQKYLGNVQPDPPRRDIVVQVPDYLRVQTLERVLGVSKDTLRAYNPSLLPPIWEGAKYVPRGFRIRLPAGVIEQVPEKLLAAVPASQRFDNQRADRNYKVRRGDTLAGIAARNNVSVTRLVAVNGLKAGAKPRSGQVLKLPPPDSAERDTSVARSDNAPRPERVSPPPQVIAAAPEPAPDIAAAADTPERQVDLAERGSPSRADPSDYMVRQDGTIEIQAAETLSQVADWLGVSADELRDLNHLSRNRGLQLGQRLKLNLDHTGRDAFVEKRVAYHRGLQEEFFSRYRITDTTEHRLRSGESLWVLALQKYKVPVWLLRQYNPDLDLNQVRPGTRIVFPRIELVSATAPAHGHLAQAF